MDWKASARSNQVQCEVFFCVRACSSNESGTEQCSKQPFIFDKKAFCKDRSISLLERRNDRERGVRMRRKFLPTEEEKAIILFIVSRIRTWARFMYESNIGNRLAG